MFNQTKKLKTQVDKIDRILERLIKGTSNGFEWTEGSNMKWVVARPGLEARLKELEDKNQKLQALLNEVIDYVYSKESKE